MVPFIPDDQVQFAQLAVKQRFLVPEQVRAALDLYRRYQAAGGDVPSIPRILVGKGWLDRQRAEMLLRHLIKGEPLATVQAPAASARSTPSTGVAHAAASGSSGGLQPSDFDVLDELGLEPPGSAVDLPVAQPVAEDDPQELLKGMGARVVKSKDLIKGYKILDVLGEGSMGIMYQAHQISMDRTVALKVLPEDKTRDQSFVEDFLAEARNAGRLNHPNLIRVHEVARSGDVYYYSMEYIEGQRLDEWMDECEGGRLEPKRAVVIFAQVAQALDYGFRAGVIHREIRPNSIMVNVDGQSKLADLGLTKGEEQRFLDGENAYYVAPEQVKGSPVDTRADIYSLGCCLFHCLTGERPFEGGAPKEVLQRRLGAPPPDAHEFNPAISPELAKVVMRMMAGDPAERYQTPAEAADALKKVNLNAPILKKPLPGKKPFKPPARSGRPIGGPPPISARPKSNPMFKPHSAKSAATHRKFPGPRKEP